jgi:sugar lactone lactonase YvrE
MQRTRTLLLLAATAALIIPAGVATASPPAGQNVARVNRAGPSDAGGSTGAHRHRGGQLHVRKECSQYAGKAGDFCTITSSNLKAITAGSRVIYEEAPGATSLDTDIVLYRSARSRAFGHVVLDVATGTGTVTFDGGTGRFRQFRAAAWITNVGGVNFAWDGTYSFGRKPRVLTTGLDGALGTTIGPDGALYAVEGLAGRVTRIDPRTGRTTTFVSGLPKRISAVGGAMDIAFLGRTPYVLVTIVSPDVGGTHVDGIYRIDGPHSFTVIADIGAWSIAHPPKYPFFIDSGVQFALQPYRGGFLVSDGHHNRVLRVSLIGAIKEVVTFKDIVPTGLDVRGRHVYLAQAGPVPHLPENGKIVTFTTRHPHARTVASGARLLVDVEFGPHGQLYALSQGIFTPGHAEGSPANSNTGSLVRVNCDGTMTPIVTGLNLPTSLEFIGKRAYIAGLGGDVVTLKVPTSRGHH